MRWARKVSPHVARQKIEEEPSDRCHPSRSTKAGRVRRRHDALACTATYAFESFSDLRDHFEGRTSGEEYGRYGNPTVRAAEKKLAALDAANDCALFASGMAAITSTLFALLRAVRL